MATLQDLRNLGYDVGIAHGDAQRERDTLAAMEALAAGAPSLAALEVALNALDDAIQGLPEGDQRREMQGQAEGIRLNMASIADLSSAIEQQRRAVTEAENMPTIYVVSGPGVGQIYLAQTDQEQIDQLADAGTYAERVFQAGHGEAMAAAADLSRLGYRVERPDPGRDRFVVDGQDRTAAQIVQFVKNAKQKPSTQEKVAMVLASAPELGDATRAALIEALGGQAP